MSAPAGKRECVQRSSGLRRTTLRATAAKRRNHTEASYPDAVHGRARQHALGFIGLCTKCYPRERCHCDNERDIVEAAAVIHLPPNRPVRDGGTRGIAETHGKQSHIEPSPVSCTDDPTHSQSSKKGELLRRIQNVQVAIV